MTTNTNNITKKEIKQCPNCKNNFTSELIVVAGKEFPKQYVCDDCCKKLDRLREREKEQENKAKIFDYINKCRLKPRYIKEADSIKITQGNKALIEKFRNFDYNSKNFIILWGKNNQGKTLLLTAIGIKLCKNMKNTLYINESEICENYREDASFFSKLKQDLYNSKFILFDDIGKTDYYNQFYAGFLYNIWEIIWNYNKILIGASNFPPEKLQGRLDLRCYSRLSRGNPEFFEIKR